MGQLKFANNVTATIASAVLTTDTAVPLSAGNGAQFPVIAAGEYYYVTLVTAANALEIVKVTSRAVDTLTVVRAQDGTTARAFAASDKAEMRVTAAMLSILEAGSAVAGFVTMFAGAAAPSGYLLCDGAAVSRTTYAALFTAVGTTWGVGDGTTTFALPDMRGRAPIGVGTGTGLTARALAATTGVETHTLSTAEMPSHSHSAVYGDNAPAFFDSGGAQSQVGIPGSVTATSSGAAVTSGSTGGGSSHINMQPSAAINFIIKT